MENTTIEREKAVLEMVRTHGVISSVAFLADACREISNEYDKAGHGATCHMWSKYATWLEMFTQNMQLAPVKMNKEGY